jgi:hypothetical protein
VSLDRWREIVERAVAEASKGDAKAREWLASYLVGKPNGDGLAQLAEAERPPDAFDIALAEHEARDRAELAALFAKS